MIGRVGELRASTSVQGLRAAQCRVEVQAPRRRVCSVWLYRAPPAAPGELVVVARWRLVAPPGARAVTVDSAGVVGDHIELVVGGEPDAVRYRLEFAATVEGRPAVAFDPLRRALPVRLRPECADGWRTPAAPVAPPTAASPRRDRLARDYHSLRRALVEHLQTEDPGADLSPADPTVALIELFAHAGDLLHYRLDRVATEAYLETARLRTSIRRHARLVDFRVGEGASARTFVHLTVPPGAAPPAAAPATVAVRAGDVAADAPASSLAFTLEAGLDATNWKGEIPIYDWGEPGAWLAAGATTCVLVRPRLAVDPPGRLWLAPGELLAFEVVDPADARGHATWAAQQDPASTWPPGPGPAGNPRFRDPLPSRPAQVVQLTEVVALGDPLRPDLALTRVAWRREDALARPLPVSIDSHAGGDEVTVARANVVPAHHGRVVAGPAGTTAVPRPGEEATAWSLAAAGVRLAGGPGLALDEAGLPHRLEVEVTLPSGSVTAATVVGSLLEAPAGSLSVVVETEDHEPPALRFRTGAVGVGPPLGSGVAARYEVGGGSVGNVPANALRTLERDANAGTRGLAPDFRAVPGVSARNPVAATGGADPVALDDVRRDAPQAFATRPRRAVLATDHAEAAVAAGPPVVWAGARRSWSGSWPLVTTVVDLVGAGVDAAGATPGGARAGLQARLDGLRMLGTESAVVVARAVGLVVGLDVCATAGTDPEALRARVLARLGPSGGPRPWLGWRAPELLGSALFASGLVAAAAGVEGVDRVEVRELRRLGQAPGPAPPGILFGPDEVPVLDDDGDHPERGRLDVRVWGGR